MAKLGLKLAAVGMVAATALFAQIGPGTQNLVAQPGAVNYVEGSVTLDGRAITNSSVGSAEVDQGQVIATTQGKAEILLTPGIFLRLDDNSALRMVSNSLTNTQVQLQSGRAMVEVDMIAPENRVTVVDNGYTTQLLKKGLYLFDEKIPLVAVYDGKATVLADDRKIELGKGHQLNLTADVAHMKAQKFDTQQTSELYAWSKLRSQYMAQASIASAQTIYVENPAWWYGTGWYWNPWFASWAFVPGAGYFWGPFGYGFFAPPVVFAYAPVIHYGPYRGFAPPIRGFSGFRGGFRASAGPSFRGAPMGGFHGGFNGGGRGGRR
ncbi:MAG TPA: FecR domain-containing protein [Bryobacteraceae bacterium]|nr:FecR domain-containing protein [Bryobacteraceae bacterium]